jgi:hypothetical protein
MTAPNKASDAHRTGAHAPTTHGYGTISLDKSGIDA